VGMIGKLTALKVEKIKKPAPTVMAAGSICK
jgi:hypothetical protein